LNQIKLISMQRTFGYIAHSLLWTRADVFSFVVVKFVEILRWGLLCAAGTQIKLYCFVQSGLACAVYLDWPQVKNY